MTVYKYSKISILSIASILLLSICGCKKLVETDPPSDWVSGQSAFSSDATAIAVVNNIYVSMGYSFQGANGVTLLSGIASDEFNLASVANLANWQAYYKNSLVASQTKNLGSEQWTPLYSYIFQCNNAIEGLSKANNLTSLVKQQLLGEVKFLRAFCYFYLVNEFGDVPLCLTTDAKITAVLPRTTVSKVYEQIVKDLEESEELLSDHYLDGTLFNSSSDRTRPTKWAATALLARTYLYTKDWAKAEQKATTVISNSNLFGPLPQLNNAFLKTSREAIWQLQPTDVDFNTLDAQFFVITSFGLSGANPVYLSNNLLNSFESNDQRAANGYWINAITIGSTTYRYPSKYKINSSPGVTSPAGMSEYFMVLRLGEQYLIRAEARARLGNNLAGAIDDLDKIRGRATLPLIATTNPTISQSALIDKILHERQVELFCEWGHRWFDLKRTNKIDEVMSIVTPQKAAGAPWQSYQQLCPLPYVELQRNPYLSQNPGY